MRAFVFMMLAFAAAAAGQEFVPLFDGKTLDGWEVCNGFAKYRVEGGAIVGSTAEGSPNSFLCTKKEYGDFVLEFEVKDDPALNSGVQVRSHRYAAETTVHTFNGKETAAHKQPAGRVYGYQVEIASEKTRHFRRHLRRSAARLAPKYRERRAGKQGLQRRAVEPLPHRGLRRPHTHVGERRGRGGPGGPARPERLHRASGASVQGSARGGALAQPAHPRYGAARLEAAVGRADLDRLDAARQRPLEDRGRRAARNQRGRRQERLPRQRGKLPRCDRAGALQNPEGQQRIFRARRTARRWRATKWRSTTRNARAVSGNPAGAPG